MNRIIETDGKEMHFVKLYTFYNEVFTSEIVDYKSAKRLYDREAKGLHDVDYPNLQKEPSAQKKKIELYIIKNDVPHLLMETEKKES